MQRRTISSSVRKSELIQVDGIKNLKERFYINNSRIVEVIKDEISILAKKKKRTMKFQLRKLPCI